MLPCYTDYLIWFIEIIILKIEDSWMKEIKNDLERDLRNLLQVLYEKQQQLNIVAEEKKEWQSKISSQTSAIETLAHQISELTENLAEREQAILSLTAKAAEQDGQMKVLAAQAMERDEQMKVLAAQATEREQEKRTLANRLAQSQEEVLIYALSKSWRMTRPIRKIARFIRSKKNV
jgi:chromosome segregation ATPase